MHIFYSKTSKLLQDVVEFSRARANLVPDHLVLASYCPPCLLRDFVSRLIYIFIIPLVMFAAAQRIFLLRQSRRIGNEAMNIRGRKKLSAISLFYEHTGIMWCIILFIVPELWSHLSLQKKLQKITVLTKLVTKRNAFFCYREWPLKHWSRGKSESAKIKLRDNVPSTAQSP